MPDYQQLHDGNSDGCKFGESSADKIGFYGKVPVIQRAYSSAVHATSGYASSASFGATQLAIQVEMANTFVGLGIWATA
jgi:hypothetical protein